MIENSISYQKSVSLEEYNSKKSILRKCTRDILRERNINPDKVSHKQLASIKREAKQKTLNILESN